MTEKPTTRALSDKHEIFLAELFDGRRTKGSGNQFNDQMDGRNRRYDQPHALAWDGKATQGKSVGITRAMWAKAVEQSNGETPLLALRWYGEGYSLRTELDLVTLDAHDFAAILADARAYRAAKETGCDTGSYDRLEAHDG
jgi:hypothetical protein